MSCGLEGPGTQDDAGMHCTWHAAEAAEGTSSVRETKLCYTWQAVLECFAGDDNQVSFLPRRGAPLGNRKLRKCQRCSYSPAIAITARSGEEGPVT